MSEILLSDVKIKDVFKLITKEASTINAASNMDNILKK